MAVHLVYFEGGSTETHGLAGELDAVVLREGLWLVDWNGTRSRLYHDVKHTLRKDAPLLVGRLDEPPKFKKVAAGALSWVREHFDSDG